MSHHIISYHIISYYVMSHHIISYYIISYHIISYHIISYHIISYHIIKYDRPVYYIIISSSLSFFIFFWTYCKFPFLAPLPSILPFSLSPSLLSFLSIPIATFSPFPSLHSLHSHHYILSIIRYLLIYF